MALRKNFELACSVRKEGEFWVSESTKETHLARDVYIKVQSVSGSKESLTATVLFSGENFTGKKNYIFVPSMDSENFIAQAYAHLKTLPEFAGATDC